MERKQVKLIGISPLMVQSDRLANPLDPLAKELKQVTGKRTKTDDDYEMIYRLKWEGGLYHDGKEPIMPGYAIRAMIRSGAKLSKRGRHIQRGVQIAQPEVPIDYDGPKGIEELWADERFRDVRSVNVNNSKVMTCRPIFHDWALTFTLTVNEQIINMSEVLDILELCGEIEGLCENRMNSYGRFTVESV